MMPKFRARVKRQRGVVTSGKQLTSTYGWAAPARVL